MKTIRDLNQLPPKEKYRPGRVVIGVDPGVSGGVAVHYAGGEIYTFNMPKEVEGIIDLDSKIPKIVKITIIKMKILICLLLYNKMFSYLYTI